MHLSMILESYPDVYKIEKIKPLFKKGSKTDSSNYRPISLLHLLSLVVLDQTKEPLSFHKILHDYQYGFRKNHSTDTCLFFLKTKFEKVLMMV